MKTKAKSTDVVDRQLRLFDDEPMWHQNLTRWRESQAQNAKASTRGEIDGEEAAGNQAAQADGNQA